MTEPTEATVEQAAPAQWIERLEIFRERFRLRLIDEIKFKEILRSFQFSDNLGHIWMPGATTNQWYRWDRTQWSAAAPPAQLTASEIPIAISFAWTHQVPAPPPLTKTQVAASALPRGLPEARFEIPPAPPAGSQKRARPSDLPERGRTRGPSKPPDLPR